MYGRMSRTRGAKIKPGDYAFKGGERIPDVMRHLVKGDFDRCDCHDSRRPDGA